MTSLVQAKLCTADEAISLIESGSTLVSGGFVGAAHAEALTSALERRFLATGIPNALTLVYGAGQGDGKSRGLNHLAHPKLLRRVIGGHWGLAPRLGELAIDDQIEAYNFPQGVICQLLRDIAAGRPGTVTRVGLGTFIDPAHGGGRLNRRTIQALVERIELGGTTWLFYRSMPLHVGLIRASAADSNGSLLMDQEAIIGEVLQIAQAVHNCGGTVIAQVKQLVDGAANPHAVVVPGMLVDRIVLSQPNDHDQTFAESFNPAFCEPAHDSASAGRITAARSMPSDERRIIACRACDELAAGSIANLGIGMPEGIARIAFERGLLGTVTLTVESGPIGGMPAGGLSFGASNHPHAIVDQPAQFDFYDGGGLDYAALGAAQIDRQGNVNVSKFGQRFVGVGGFVNIAQNARKLIFCGTLTAGDLEVAVTHGKLSIIREGANRKFVEAVEQVCFSAARDTYRATQVLYVTERAVFQLTEAGLELIEVAPGIDIESQVVAAMGFRPLMREVRPMPASCFTATSGNERRS